MLYIKPLINILLPTSMRIIFIAIAQSIYLYGIGTWGGAYDKYYLNYTQPKFT